MHDGPAKRELSASPPPSPQLTRQKNILVTQEQRTHRGT
jgi:hypothetical protein